MNWHVRMICPCAEGGRGVGHYDLQLVGKYTFDGITYTNPVFSYSREGRTGFLSIFDKSISAAVYKEYLPYKGYIYHDRSASSDAQYRAFVKLMWAYVNTGSKRAIDVTDANGAHAGKYYRYSITSAYRNYDMAARNCFKAVGLWMEALGDTRFVDFAKKHAYTDYTAHPMIENHPSLWDFTDVYA